GGFDRLRGGMEERDVAEPAVLPERERSERGHEREREKAELAQTSRKRKREERPGEEERVRRLDPDREPGSEAGGERVDSIAVIDRADARERREQEADRRGVVAEPGQPERLWQELLDVPRVVALVEERDQDERGGDPESRRRVAARPS